MSGNFVIIFNVFWHIWIIWLGVVLTAAHCISGLAEFGPKVFTIRAGDWDLAANNEILPHRDSNVRHFVIHPQYNKGSYHNDAALLFLENAVELGQHINTACLPNIGDVIETMNCTVLRWALQMLVYCSLFVFSNQSPFSVLPLSPNSWGIPNRVGGEIIMQRNSLKILQRDRCTQLVRNSRSGPQFQLHSSFLCVGKSIFNAKINPLFKLHNYNNSFDLQAVAMKFAKVHT